MLLTDKYLFIVEDNLQNRVIFQMLMARHGARVEFDRWGKDAMLRLKYLSRLDLIILDLMLADGISGFDIFDEIRTVPTLQRIPVVAVSAMDVEVAVPMAQKKGFNGFISKPIDNKLFPEQIARILSGEQVWLK